MMEKNGNCADLIDYSILQMALHFDSIIRSIYNATTTHLSKIKFWIKIWFTLFESCKSFQNHTSCICIILWTFLKYLSLALLMFFWIYLLSKVFFIEIHRDNWYTPYSQIHDSCWYVNIFDVCGYWLSLLLYILSDLTDLYYILSYSPDPATNSETTNSNFHNFLTN